jgi:hypothetical protein
MRCRMSRGTGTGHPVLEGSNGGTCLMDPDPRPSMLRRGPVSRRIMWLRTLPPCTGGLRSRHASHGPKSRLPAREGSDAATRLAALRGP